MTLIHFNCFALVGYEELGSDDEEEQLWPRNFGIYLTESAANEDQRRIEQERERKCSEEVMRIFYPGWVRPAEPPKWTYHIIPLSEITCKDFYELDQAIEAAAKLRGAKYSMTALSSADNKQ